MKGLFCFALVASALSASTPKAEPAAAPPVDVAAGSRSVEVNEHDIVQISARVRFTTVIILPKGEQILDFACGDKEFWSVQGAENFALVKPSKPGIQTSLNLITASDNVYSFVLSESAAAPPDLKVVIHSKDGALLSNMKAGPRFVAVSALDDYRAQLEQANVSLKRVREESAQQVKAAQEAAATALERHKAQIPGIPPCPYRYVNQPEFNVQAICHDDKFTYIRATPHEVPAIYELQDDKPSLIHFEFSDGLYTIDKIVNRGYLAIGKKKMHFYRESKPR